MSNPGRKKVIAFGDVNVDLMVEIPEKNVIKKPAAELFSGGTVGNTAAGLARLDLDVLFLGKIGGDSYGRFIIEDFRREGVGTQYLLKDDDDFTLMVIAFIDEKGERHNVAWPPRGTAQFNIRPSDFPESVWNGVNWFHTSGIIMGEPPAQKTVLHIMREARRRRIPVSFDLNLRLEYFGWRPGVKETVLEAVSLSDFIFASLTEELVPLTDCSDYQSAVSCLNHPGLTVIARQGKDETYVFSGGKTKSYRTFNIDVKDTLGAGDAFNSGFIFGMLSGFGIDKSIETAHGSAGYNLTRVGARELPTVKELFSFIKKNDLR